ncbi:MAG: hypothetical protein ACMUIE_00760 [Thermoplasmatota archaeon]
MKTEIHRCDDHFALIENNLVLLLPGVLFVAVAGVGFFSAQHRNDIYWVSLLSFSGIFGFLLIFIVIFYFFTMKPFIIFDSGIQYPTAYILFFKNYKNHFIPYSEIEEIDLVRHDEADYLIFHDNRGWKYEMPYGCICMNVGKNRWRMAFPYEEMINYWSKGKPVKKETIKSMRGSMIRHALTDE